MGMNRMACGALGAMLATALSWGAWAEGASGGRLVANPAGFAWEDAPPAFPRGARIARLSGDPTKPGPFALMVRLPGKYELPPHWHDRDRQILVVSGRLFVGVGDRVDLDTAEHAKAGSYIFVPAKTHHWLRARSKTLFELHGEGPLDIHFVGGGK